MTNVAGIEVPSASPIFLAVVAFHVVLGLACVVTGAVAMLSPKRQGRHPNFGTMYFWCLLAVVVSASGLSAVHWTRDYPLFILGSLSFAAALGGRTARRKRWPGWVRWHITGMGVSYILLLTAFYVDNGKSLPIWKELPRIAYWLLPGAIGSPIFAFALLRHPLVSRIDVSEYSVMPDAEAVSSIKGNQGARTPHGRRKRTLFRKLWMALATIAGFMLLGWVALAFESGAFIREDSIYAVAPGDFTPDAMAAQKKLIDLGNYKVAYIDEGKGEPVILLHGCPFSVFEWHEIAPLLAKHFRVIAPDLLGLGDTPVRLNDDYRLTQDVKMVTALMDRLGIRSARFIGHDHGGAVIQLLMQQHPDRIDMAILTNVEAYDQWPSKPETADLHLITNPVTSPLVYLALHFRPVQRDLYSIAVVDRSTLADETLDAFASEHLATARRWQRLRRFFAYQLDSANNRLTQDAVPAMRLFTRPVLLLWGQKDTNFGPLIAKRLASDIPGTVGISWLTNSAHLPMLEQPQEYSDIAYRFLSDGRVDQSAKAAIEESCSYRPCLGGPNPSLREH
jgi:pimeloyl-ACP methyl ester carboxylesterase/uncharacterized membrane protein